MPQSASDSLQGLCGRAVAVIGYGNQGRSHALNLRDSGIPVLIGTRFESQGRRLAESDGFDVRTIEDASAAADLLVFGITDSAHATVWQSVRAAVKPHVVLGFMHGFSVHFGQVKAPAEIGVVLLAPKGPGAILRSRFLVGSGLLGLIATAQTGSDPDRTEAILAAWACGIGCTRVGLLRTTFAEETETDLFGEQAVLCGGIAALARTAFELLVEAGYSPELAYNECCHEIQLIGDLIGKHGMAGMLQRISSTAAYGSAQAGPMIVDAGVRQKMQEMLCRIRSGEFAAAINADQMTGSPAIQSLHRDAANHPMEAARLKLLSAQTGSH